MWAILPSIQTKPGHILENTNAINFHSAGVGVKFLSDLKDLCF